jgi:hypothetical protein
MILTTNSDYFEVSVLPGHDAALLGSSFRTFQDNIVVSSARLNVRELATIPHTEFTD